MIVGMRCFLKKYLLILLTAVLWVYVPGRSFWDETENSRGSQLSLMYEGVCLPYGVTLPQKEEGSFFRPDSGSVSHRWKTNRSFIQEITGLPPDQPVFLFCKAQKNIFNSTKLFSALFSSGGTYYRKLIPKTSFLS